MGEYRQLGDESRGRGGAMGAFNTHMAGKAGWVSSQYNAGINRFWTARIAEDKMIS